MADKYLGIAVIGIVVAGVGAWRRSEEVAVTAGAFSFMATLASVFHAAWGQG